MLNSILTGLDKKAETKLKMVLETIGDNPNILWYPSAGRDFRDLMEAQIRTGITPDLFIHTDYNKELTKLTCGIIYNDDKTKVIIHEVHHLTTTNLVNYYIDPKHINLPKYASLYPRVLLLDISIDFEHYTGVRTIIRKPLLFFIFENINFLDEILLKFKIPISHIVKIREGCAWGGNSKSITISYAFVSELNTQYLLIDSRLDVDFNLVQHLKKKHDIIPKNYNLKRVSQRSTICDWSGLSAQVFRVEHKEEELNIDTLKITFAQL